MSTVQITRVFRKTVDTRFGMKPQLSIQTNQHGEKWLSTFKVAGTEGWAAGDTVEINVSENGNFLNFTPVGVSTSGSGAASDIIARIAKLEHAVFGSSEVRKDPEPVINADDLPEGFDAGVDDGF